MLSVFIVSGIYLSNKKSMIKVAVLDDYQNAFQQIVDIEKYKDKFDFKVFNEPYRRKRSWCCIRRL